MHIEDGILSPAACGAWYGVTAAFVVPGIYEMGLPVVETADSEGRQEDGTLSPLAYLAATGVDPSAEVGPAALRSACGSLDLLVLTPITAETEQFLPPAELPGLRAAMNDALLELAYDDPLDALAELPILELSGPLSSRLATVLAALRPLPG